MPRNGANIYSKPAGSTAVSGTTIESAKYNSVIDDLVTDANTPRPVVAGGTGASSAAGALTALGLTATAAEINVLDGVTATTAELNVLDGIPATLTATELGYVDGVTSAIQTQLNTLSSGKQALDQDLTDIAAVTRSRGMLLRGGAAAWEGVALGSVGQVAVSDGTDTVFGQEGLYFRLNAANVGANVTTAQNVLPQNVTVLGNTIYDFELVYSLVKTAGATSHNVQMSFAGTATLNNAYRSIISTSAIGATFNNFLGAIGYTTNFAETVNTSGTLANANTIVHVVERGTISINAGGTIIPQYILSAAPGGAYSVVAGAYFNLRRLGASGGNVSQGSWA